MCEQLITGLKSDFELSSYGKLEYYLGCKIVQDDQAGTVMLSQEQYTEDVLRRFNMEHANPVSTPPAGLLSTRTAKFHPRTRRRGFFLSLSPWMHCEYGSATPGKLSRFVQRSSCLECAAAAHMEGLPADVALFGAGFAAAGALRGVAA